MALHPFATLVRPNLLLFLTRERVPLSAPVDIEQVSKSVVTVLSMITRSYYNIYDNNLLLWPYIEHIVCVCSLQVTGMFSLYLRERIVRLSSQGHKPKAIVALLLQGFWVSLRGVYYVLKRYKTTGSVFDRPCSGHPQIVSEEGQKLIDDWILNNDELTTTELMHKLAEQEHCASRATVGRLRQSLWWTAKATRYCQLIQEVNKLKRVEFCQRVLEAGKNFNNIVFTDETMVKLAPSKRNCTIKRVSPESLDQRQNTLLRSTFGLESLRLGNQLCPFTGTMDAKLYPRARASWVTTLHFFEISWWKLLFSARQRSKTY